MYGTGQPWNSESDRVLLDLISEGLSQPEIATRLHRTTTAIRSRLAALRRAERLAEKLQ